MKGTEQFFDASFQRALKADGKVQKEIHRGDIYFYLKPDAFGDEIQTKKGRPCLIISNDGQNTSLYDLVTVIPITSKIKDCPNAVLYRGKLINGLILTQQITTISKDRLTDYAEEVDDVTMRKVNEALRAQLQLPVFATNKQLAKAEREAAKQAEEPAPAPAHAEEDTSKIEELQTEITAITSERDLYKRLYDSLLDKLVGKN